MLPSGANTDPKGCLICRGSGDAGGGDRELEAVQGPLEEQKDKNTTDMRGMQYKNRHRLVTNELESATGGFQPMHSGHYVMAAHTGRRSHLLLVRDIGGGIVAVVAVVRRGGLRGELFIVVVLRLALVAGVAGGEILVDTFAAHIGSILGEGVVGLRLTVVPEVGHDVVADSLDDVIGEVAAGPGLHDSAGEELGKVGFLAGVVQFLDVELTPALNLNLGLKRRSFLFEVVSVQLRKRVEQHRTESVLVVIQPRAKHDSTRSNDWLEAATTREDVAA